MSRAAAQPVENPGVPPFHTTSADRIGELLHRMSAAATPGRVVHLGRDSAAT